MKQSKKAKALSILLTSAMIMTNSPVTVSTAAKKTVSLKKTKATLYITKTDIKTSYGKTTIKVKTSKGVKIISKKFKAKNSKIASVSKKGLVKAKKNGSTKITVTIKYKQKKKKNTKKLTFKVIVKTKDNRTNNQGGTNPDNGYQPPAPNVPDINDGNNGNGGGNPIPTERPAPSYVTTDTIKDGQNYPNGVVVAVKPGQVIVIDGTVITPAPDGTITITEDGFHHIEITDGNGNVSHVDITVGSNGHGPQPPKPTDNQGINPPEATDDPDGDKTPSPSASGFPSQTDKPGSTADPGTVPSPSSIPTIKPTNDPDNPSESDDPSGTENPSNTENPTDRPSESGKPSDMPGGTTGPSQTDKPSAKPTATPVPPHNHVYDEWEAVTPASCTTKGVKKRSCNICGNEEIAALASLGGHLWGGWQESVEPFCTTNGSEYRVCKRCNEKQSRSINPLGVHEWGSWSVTQEPSCEKKGIQERICAKCGQKAIEYIDPYGEHRWGEWEVSITPNCSTTGTEERICERCGKKQTQNIFNIGQHVWNEWDIIKEASCNEKGLKRRTCDNCDKTEEKEIPAIGSHSYGDWETVKEATCTEAGTKQKTCSICNKKITEEIVPEGFHKWGEWTAETEALCIKDGVKSRVCDNCGYVQQDTIPPIGHHSFSEWFEDEEATCDSSGTMIRECRICDATEKKVTPVLGHKWGEWQESNSATCASEGEQERTCETCWKTEVRNLSGLSAHTWGEWEIISEPMCNVNGIKQRECYVCDKMEEEIIPGYTEHSFTEWEIILKGSCLESGYKERYCTTCNEIESEMIPAFGSHSYKEVMRRIPSCFEAGEITYRCLECRDEYEEAIPMIGHHTYADDSWHTTLPSGCDSMGTEEARCIVCDEIQERDLPSLGKHFYGEWNITKAPACSEYGEKERTCSLCGDVETEDVPPTENHIYGEWEIIDEPSCFYVGSRTRACNVCGSSEVEDIPSYGIHDFDYENGEITYEPECFTDGEIMYTCKRCNDIYTETIPAKGSHSWLQTYEYDKDGETVTITANSNGWLVLEPPTCGETGFKTKICKDCGYEDNLDIMPTFEHAWSSYNVVYDSCMEDGYKERSCTVCDAYEQEIAPAIGHHSYLDDSWHIIENNSCLEDGKQERACSICNYIEEQVIPAFGSHDFKRTFVTDREPTCEETGQKSWHCTRCDAITMETEIPAKGHTWSNFVKTKSPTCEEYGSEYRYCTVCNAKETREIEPLGHVISASNMTSYFAPTCESEGTKIGTCSRCGAKNAEQSIPSTGHRYDYYTSDSVACTEGATLEWVCVNEVYDRYGNVIGICGAGDENDTTHPPIYKEALGHNFLSSWTIDEPATCQQEGLRSHHCNRCDERKDETVIPMLDHSVATWNMITVASCMQEGYREGYCTSCKETIGETIPSTSHNFAYHPDSERACEEGANYDWVCINKTYDKYGNVTGICGAEDENDTTHPSYYSPALGHSFQTYWTVDEPATCQQEGLKSHHCSRCDERKDETVIPMTNHSVATWNTLSEATCMEEGYMEGYCTSCKNTIQETIPSNPHNFQYHSDSGATCTEGVTQEWVCVNDTYDKYGRVTGICGAEDENDTTHPPEYVPALGHEFQTDFTTDEPATCQQEGLKSRHCSRCDERIEETIIPMEAHVFDEKKWTTIEEATCEEDGYKECACKNCGETKEQPISKTGHEFGGWTTIEKTTCEDEGYEEATCSKCGETKGRYINPLGHDITNVKDTCNATCESEGYKYGYCTRCEQDATITIPPTGHKIIDDEGHFVTYQEYVSYPSTTYGRNYEITTEPTCEIDGQGEKRLTCQAPTYDEYGRQDGICGADLSSRANPPVSIERLTEHTWNEWRVDVAATCVHGGSNYRTCDVCGIEQTETTNINSANHEALRGANVSGTCSTMGTYTVTCISCHTIVSQENTLYGHVWNGSSLTCSIHGSMDDVTDGMNGWEFVKKTADMFTYHLAEYNSDTKTLIIRTWYVDSHNTLYILGTTSKTTLKDIVNHMISNGMFSGSPCNGISKIVIENKYNDTSTTRGSCFLKRMWNSKDKTLRYKDNGNHVGFFNGITDKFWGSDTIYISGMGYKGTAFTEEDVDDGPMNYICSK